MEEAEEAEEGAAADQADQAEGGGGGRGRQYQLLHAAVTSKLERASGELRAARADGEATTVSMRRAQRLAEGLHDALDLCTRHLAALIAASKASQKSELERLTREGERLTQTAAAFEEALSRRRAAAAARKQQGGGGGDDDDDDASDGLDDKAEAEVEVEAGMAGEGLGEAMAKVRAWRPAIAVGGSWAAKGGGGEPSAVLTAGARTSAASARAVVRAARAMARCLSSLPCRRPRRPLPRPRTSAWVSPRKARENERILQRRRSATRRPSC